MPYTRRFLHYSPGPTDLVGEISGRAIAGAWFELHRKGGCGAGELRLNDEFPDREAIEVGDWIAFEFDTGDRWYLGRVEQRQANSPAGLTFRLNGMSGELKEVFPGGFRRDAADGVPPHRYAQTDLFPDDPDYLEETVDPASEPHEVVTLLMQQYVAPRTHITVDESRIESASDPTSVTSLKFRGEETVQSILQELALRARNASWGVDAEGTFFFLRPRTTVAATYRESVDLISLEESQDRESLFNRIVLTGGYIYEEPSDSGGTGRTVFRWRGHYIQPVSRDTYGERRIRLWVPWIRTPDDSRAFAREFFRVYSEPATRYFVEVGDQTSLPRPWEGPIRIEDLNGGELITRQVETIRVQFDHAPRFRMEIGPEPPHNRWPEPPQNERYAIPGEDVSDFGGDLITLTSESSSDGGGTVS